MERGARWGTFEVVRTSQQRTTAEPETVQFVVRILQQVLGGFD